MILCPDGLVGFVSVFSGIYMHKVILTESVFVCHVLKRYILCEVFTTAIIRDYLQRNRRCFTVRLPTWLCQYSTHFFLVIFVIAINVLKAAII